MFNVLLVMFAGIAAGYLFRKMKFTASAGKAAGVVIWVMLFALGVEIGSDPEVRGNLSVLGLQALLFAAAGVIGSVLAAVLVYRTLFRNGSGIAAGESPDMEDREGRR